MRTLLQRTVLCSDYHTFDRTMISRFVEDAARSIPSGSIVVDAGAGEGMYKHLFGHTNYLGVDRGIGDSSWNYGALDVVCDLHLTPFKEGCVNYIISTQTLEHIRRPETVVAEFQRMLVPGGKAFCTLPFQGDGHHQEPYDFFRFTRYAIEDIFKSAGFGNVEIHPVGGYYTLIVGLLQKRIISIVERQFDRPKPVLLLIRFVYSVVFVVTRWMNWLAWKLDQRDPERYKFAMDFAVVASK